MVRIFMIDPLLAHFMVKMVLLIKITMEKSQELQIEFKRKVIDIVFKLYVLLHLKTKF